MAKKRGLHATANAELTQEEWEEIRQEIHFGSDRSATIVLSSIIEQQLWQLISKRFKRKDPIALGNWSDNLSFYTKIHFAYAMGVIEHKLRDDLETIRKLRNAFAHSQRPLRFDKPEIAELVNSLRIYTDKSHPGHTMFKTIAGKDTGRPRIISGLLGIAAYLVTIELNAARRRKYAVQKKLKENEAQLAALEAKIAEAQKNVEGSNSPKPAPS